MSDILSKIHKLLNLSRSTNEHEATAAAARAAALLREHDLSLAEVEAAAADGGAAPAPEDPIESRFYATDHKYKNHWQFKLYAGAARANGCRAYWTGARICLFGRTAKVATVQYLAQWLCVQVDSFTRTEAHGQGKSYAQSFRLGCADRIAERLTKDAQEATAVERRAITEGGNAGRQQALVRVEAAQRAVDDEYARFSARFRSARPARAADGGGYAAGRAAGDRADLGGGGTRRLGSGQHKLR